MGGGDRYRQERRRRERIRGVASRYAKRFLCDCDQRENNWTGGAQKRNNTEGELYSASQDWQTKTDHEPHFVTVA